MLLRLGASQERTDAEFAAVLTALGAKLGNAAAEGPGCWGKDLSYATTRARPLPR
ncbi:hypothetical protein AB0399_02260 [Streptomyces sp. NPDC088194]|uniref:hypothetical protein n=1 Tax=Streptomyces sp. NPDC088194 TaxID=3154931 RepID=UPI00344E4805